MIEIKILVEAPGLEKALNHTADALESIGAISIEPSAVLDTNSAPISAEGDSGNAVLMPTVNPTASNAAEVPTVPPVTTAAPVIEHTVEAPTMTEVATEVPPAAHIKPVTREQVAMAGAALLDAGKMDELIALLGEFKVQAITQLTDEQVPLVAEKLRAMGAKL